MIRLDQKYQPQTIAEFAGLARPKAILSKLASEPYASAWLLVGPSGLGKTTMAMAFAREIGCTDYDLQHIPSRQCDLETVERTVHKCWLRPLKGNWHVVIVDEADQMSNAAQLAFLSKLDTTAAPPDTIFLFTANATDLLKDRFLSRCRKIKFEPRELLEEGAALLERIWRAESTLPCPRRKYFEHLLKSANMNMREAINELETDLIAGPREIPKPIVEAIPAGDRVDAAQLARALKIDVGTVYNRIKAGRLPAPDRIGRKMTWPSSILEAAA